MEARVKNVAADTWSRQMVSSCQLQIPSSGGDLVPMTYDSVVFIQSGAGWTDISVNIVILFIEFNLCVQSAVDSTDQCVI